MTDTTGLTTPDLQGSEIPAGIRSRLLRPLARSSSPTSRHLAVLARHTAVEMTRAWKSQNDFHTRLEISHRTRDSHIPTAASRFLFRRTETKDTNRSNAAVCHDAQPKVLDSQSIGKVDAFR
jgi:hypothetical protein